jgi:adenosine deaminase
MPFKCQLPGRQSDAWLLRRDLQLDCFIRLSIRKLTKIMQQRVIVRQMVVETNPSSNLSIGSISRLEEHPIFAMAFDRNGHWQRRLRMTVNSDNPGTDNTSLSHEYYLLV